MPLLEVRQEMQRVIHRDTHYDRTDTDRDDRHILLQQRQEGHGEEQAEGDGEKDQENRPHIPIEQSQ